MDLRVAELADAAGVAVDTVRFYQARGLIPAPLRRGRFAIYTGEHLERLRRIRALLESGFSLAQIRRILEPEKDKEEDQLPEARGRRQKTARAGAAESTSLLASLAARSVGDGTLSQQELASETGVPEAIVAAAVRSGLLTPIEVHGELRFPRSDRDMLAAGLEILGEGLPLEKLLELAAEHSTSIAALAERAIDLFDDHIRKPRGEDDAAVRRAFERLLPQVTQIVALHFQRTVVARALARLREKGDTGALEETLARARSGRLEVQWR
jgi:DNA-binding transcriptional MerR regulator